MKLSGTTRGRWRSFGLALSIFAGAGCSAAEDEALDAALYASVQGIDGVYFYPPLGPEPHPAGAFEATLLDGISVVIEAEDGAGAITTLGAFDARTRPAVALLAERERYWVNIPARDYLTDPAKTYRIRALLDGAELGGSVLSPRVFDVLAWNPSLPIGVHLRVEGSGAVRALPRAIRRGGGLPQHCSDGIRNKDEGDVDCGGRDCPACEICDGLDNDGDGAIDEDQPNPPCTTGLGGACEPGLLSCTEGRWKCVPLHAGAPELCNGLDDDCDGIVDNGFTPNLILAQGTSPLTPPGWFPPPTPGADPIPPIYARASYQSAYSGYYINDDWWGGNCSAIADRYVWNDSQTGWLAVTNGGGRTCNVLRCGNNQAAGYCPGPLKFDATARGGNCGRYGAWECYMWWQATGRWYYDVYACAAGYRLDYALRCANGSNLGGGSGYDSRYNGALVGKRFLGASSGATGRWPMEWCNGNVERAVSLTPLPPSVQALGIPEERIWCTLTDASLIPFPPDGVCQKIRTGSPGAYVYTNHPKDPDCATACPVAP